MGKTTDDKENESRGFEDVALTLSSSRSFLQEAGEQL
jgi:hypothetical protein